MLLTWIPLKIIHWSLKQHTEPRSVPSIVCSVLPPLPSVVIMTWRSVFLLPFLFQICFSALTHAWPTLSEVWSLKLLYSLWTSAYPTLSELHRFIVVSESGSVNLSTEPAAPGSSHLSVCLKTNETTFNMHSLLQMQTWFFCPQIMLENLNSSLLHFRIILVKDASFYFKNENQKLHQILFNM